MEEFEGAEQVEVLDHKMQQRLEKRKISKRSIPTAKRLLKKIGKYVALQLQKHATHLKSELLGQGYTRKMLLHHRIGRCDIVFVGKGHKGVGLHMSCKDVLDKLEHQKTTMLNKTKIKMHQK
jgi:hypothetical protein